MLKHVKQLNVVRTSGTILLETGNTKIEDTENFSHDTKNVSNEFSTSSIRIKDGLRPETFRFHNNTSSCVIHDTNFHMAGNVAVGEELRKFITEHICGNIKRELQLKQHGWYPQKSYLSYARKWRNKCSSRHQEFICRTMTICSGVIVTNLYKNRHTFVETNTFRICKCHTRAKTTLRYYRHREKTASRRKITILLAILGSKESGSNYFRLLYLAMPNICDTIRRFHIISYYLNANRNCIVQVSETDNTWIICPTYNFDVT